MANNLDFNLDLTYKYLDEYGQDKLEYAFLSMISTEVNTLRLSGYNVKLTSSMKTEIDKVIISYSKKLHIEDNVSKYDSIAEECAAMIVNILVRDM